MEMGEFTIFIISQCIIPLRYSLAPAEMSSLCSYELIHNIN